MSDTPAEGLISDPDALKALPRGTRVVDSSGDVWSRQGGSDSWKMLTTTGLRTTSTRLADLWGPVALVGEDGITGHP